MICPNCKKENKNTNIRCEFCSTQLIYIKEFCHNEILTSRGSEVKPKEINVSIKKVSLLSNILFLIFVGPCLLVGLAFLGVGLFCTISEHSQTKGYEKTTGTLKDYTDCKNEDGDEVCEAIYKYQVDGITYSVSPSRLTTRDSFKENEIVYYNPNNPSESIIYADWGTLLIIGFIIVVVISIIFVIKNNFIKKISNGKDKLTMQYYK